MNKSSLKIFAIEARKELMEKMRTRLEILGISKNGIEKAKVIGKEVEVLDHDGRKVSGVLKSVDGNKFVVSVNEKVHVEGKKRPVKMDVDHEYDMNEVKYTKYLISFK